jgi:hypothetical protein
MSFDPYIRQNGSHLSPPTGFTSKLYDSPLISTYPFNHKKKPTALLLRLRRRLHLEVLVFDQGV